MTWAYYNENDAEIAAWLSNNIRAGLIAPGIVDTRSIADVQPDDLREFTQCHFFAGIGGWSYAARLAGWPDERPIWSGSCPCQPFSAAGRGVGTDDPRHLWPHLYRLVRAGRPAALVGEQVAGAAGYGWFDGVRADLAREGFASRTVDIPALTVDAPHQRNRLFWVALGNADSPRAHIGTARRAPRPAISEPNGGPCPGGMAYAQSGGGADSDSGGRQIPLTGGFTAIERGVRDYAPYSRNVGDATRGGGPVAGESEASRRTAGRGEYRGSNGSGSASWWGGAEWIICHDGKARRVADAGAPLLVNGFPNRILAWRGIGNAIVAPLATQVIGALMDVLQ